MSIGSKHCIKNDEQLDHAGAKCWLGVLTPGAQLEIKGPDNRIAADSRHGRHVKDAPNLCASAPDATDAARSTAVTIEGAWPTSACDLLAISIPSSGNCTSRVLESTLPTRGTERSNSSHSRHRGVSRIMLPSSSSRPEKSLLQPPYVLVEAAV